MGDPALPDELGKAAADGQNGRRPHVLVVEDNDVVSSALRVLFEQAGRKVSVAATIADAVRSAAAGHPDLILLDLTLPDGSGVDIVAQLRSGASPPIVVALTGRDEPSVTQRCAELGCAEVLLKPVPARELLRIASRWLDAAQ